ncbi:MAG: 3'(2'),5'-bisphosphate nucleotidase CysQ [Caulobacterales bacterium 32-69-10]|nr:MAG: 3'(2'),5'-bisphosphate nucleotidase CysQ [Caulobacterales bacterium 32-69-10]
MESDLDLLRDVAHEAGRLALSLQEGELRIETKPGGSPVTNADLAVDDLVKARLRAARPDYGWLSEETADGPERLGARRLFMVDPIDGTVAFMKGRPWWSVSLAVVEDGDALAGVIYAPGLEETYEAESGGGARLNGAPIRASGCADLQSCAMLGPRAAFADWDWAEPWPEMRIENRNSIALRMALVAAGAFDAAVALSPKMDWDVAAGLVICAEAGAIVTDHQGRGLVLNSPNAWHPSLVCAGPALHPLILQRTAPIELPPPAY